MKKHYIEIVAGMVGVLLLVLIFTGKDKLASKKIAKEADVTQEASHPRVLSQETRAAVAAFPSGFPIEEAQNSQSFLYVPAHSLEQQSTVEYVSTKSVAENKKMFSEYLQDAGFKIVNQADEPKRVLFYSSRNNNDLAIAVRETDSGVKVTASYLSRN